MCLFRRNDAEEKARTKNGVSCPLELMRQYFDYQQLYDLQAMEKKSIDGIQFTGCITYSNHRHVQG
jgi:hypothetical protein